MGLLRYTETELRDLLGRSIRIHWPDEALLIVTACRAEPLGGDPFAQTDELNDQRSSGQGPSQAVLAATNSRLIYQERTTHASLLKTIAAILGTVAAATLFFGSGLAGFAAVGVTALTLWVVAKLIELFTVGSTSIEFHRVEMVDRLAQRIVGTVRSGMVYRLRVPDPSDFGLIVSLVDGYGRSTA
jgi:hypothetical protein